MLNRRFAALKFILPLAVTSLIAGCAHRDHELSSNELTQIDEAVYPARTKFDILTPAQTRAVASTFDDDATIADVVDRTPTSEPYYQETWWDATPATAARPVHTARTVQSQEMIVDDSLDERAPASVPDSMVLANTTTYATTPSPVPAVMSWALFIFGLLGGWVLRDAWAARTVHPHPRRSNRV